MQDFISWVPLVKFVFFPEKLHSNDSFGRLTLRSFIRFLLRQKDDVKRLQTNQLKLKRSRTVSTKDYYIHQDRNLRQLTKSQDKSFHLLSGLCKTATRIGIVGKKNMSKGEKENHTHIHPTYSWRRKVGFLRFRHFLDFEVETILVCVEGQSTFQT